MGDSQEEIRIPHLGLPSQKRRSQSCPRDEADAKKGWTDNEQHPSKIQVGIDWANTGIGKPVPKPDSKHPSFRADPFRGRCTTAPDEVNCHEAKAAIRDPRTRTPAKGKKRQKRKCSRIGRNIG